MAKREAQLFCMFGVLLIIQFQSGHTIKLNSDGGYEVLVALDENTSVPSVGAANYVENIKTSLRTFSSRLWVATKNHFYLKSVDILVPSHWNVDSALSATTQSFQTADIRLSPNTTYPNADNPNVCGQPGQSIQLPSSFFNVTRSGPYGLHWKALLNTWAMYRFGVHPEHGYIDDSKYPYATRNTQSNQWTVTGCSDKPIQGKFVDITNPDVTTCGTGNAISNNCRFVPSATGQNATTSLMHFHWIESVTEFCDESNHNIHAQNKHNALCDHKSVWQIIRESTDYLAVTSPRNVSVPAVTIRTWQHSSTPLLYILLDRGLVQGSFSIANHIPRLLSNYVAHNALRNTVASIGAFPGNGNSPVIDLVQWSELGANRNAFLDTIGNLRVDGPLERDFTRALVAVADKIKAKNHPNGAVALLIKYGADVKSFGGYLPESEVFNAFNEGNIIFNAIELNFQNHTGYSHLARISQETGGSYVTLNNFGEAETNIRNVLNYVNRTLITEYTDLRKNWKILGREISTTSATIPVSSDIRGSLQIFASTHNPSLSSANFSITGYEYRTGKLIQNLSFRLRKTLDWNQDGSKFTYKLEIPQDQLGGISQIGLRLTCQSTSTGCASNILARAQLASDQPPQVKIELSTSLENDQVDLSVGRPVSIFAKVTKNGKPIQDAVVIATLTNELSVRTNIRLLDNGNHAPDAQEFDGIYSAYFAPENDGQFRLSVTVQGNPSRTITHRKLNESSFSRLLPIDQGDIGCGAAACGSETIEGNFAQMEELASAFSVIQASLYTPPPTKISLRGIDMPALGQVYLYWQSPNIPGREFARASSYELRSAPSLELLINDFDNQAEVDLPPNFRPQPPNSFQEIYIGRPASTSYYAIRSIFRGMKSSTSNVVPILMASTTPTPTTPSSSTSPVTTPSTPTDAPSSPSTEGPLPTSDDPMPTSDGPFPTSDGSLPTSDGPIPTSDGPSSPTPSSTTTVPPTSTDVNPPTSTDDPLPISTDDPSQTSSTPPPTDATSLTSDDPDPTSTTPSTTTAASSDKKAIFNLMASSLLAVILVFMS